MPRGFFASGPDTATVSPIFAATDLSDTLSVFTASITATFSTNISHFICSTQPFFPISFIVITIIIINIIVRDKNCHNCFFDRVQVFRVTPHDARGHDSPPRNLFLFFFLAIYLFFTLLHDESFLFTRGFAITRMYKKKTHKCTRRSEPLFLRHAAAGREARVNENNHPTILHVLSLLVLLAILLRLLFRYYFLGKQQQLSKQQVLPSSPAFNNITEILILYIFFSSRFF